METLLLLTLAGIAFIKLDEFKRLQRDVKLHHHINQWTRDTSYFRTDYDKDIKNLNNESIRSPEDAKRFGLRFLGDPEVHARRRNECDESYNHLLIPYHPHIVRGMYES
jgi:hypothetical protein